MATSGYFKTAGYNSSKSEMCEKVLSPGRWFSLGSEIEVEEEKRENNRAKAMKFIFKKQLKHFGCSIQLDDCPVSEEKKNVVDHPPFEDKAFNIFTLQLNKFVQHVSQTSDAICSTDIQLKKNVGTQYDPRELPEEEKNVLLGSQEMIDFLHTIMPRLLDVFEQQELVDPFTDEFSNKDFQNS